MNRRTLVLRAASLELAQRRLASFVRQAWHIVEPHTPYVESWHIGAICEHLEACRRGEIRKLLINVPPRCTKSLIVSVCWPAWCWTTAPQTRWLFASYSQRLSVRDSLKCRDVLQSPWYQRHWGNVFQLRSDQNEKVRFDNDRTGFRLATSTGGLGTGEGGDFIVADDPHNVTAIESDAERQAVVQWWNQSMSTRGNNPRTTCHVVIMQRLHERDLAGVLLEQGGYEHLCLPMEYDPRRSCATSIGWRDPRSLEGELLSPDRFPAPEVRELKRRLQAYGAAGQLQQLPAPTDGGLFRRADFRYFRLIGALNDGVPPSAGLRPASDDPFKVAEVARLPTFDSTDLCPASDSPAPSGATGRARTSQCRPSDEPLPPTPPQPAFLQDVELRSTPTAQEFSNTSSDLSSLTFELRNASHSIKHVPADECWWFQTIDTAQKTGESHDYTVIGTFAITPDHDLLVFDIFRAKIEVPRQFACLIEQRRRFPWLDFQAIEDKQSGTGLIQEGCLRGTPFRALRADTDKRRRAARVATFYANGQVYHLAAAPWLEAFEEELLRFPRGAHDDQVDVLAYAAQLVMQEALRQAPVIDRPLVLWPPLQPEL